MKLDRRSILFSLALGALSLQMAPVVAVAQDITVKHTQGEISLPAAPKTVLVFDMASIDTLDALGVEIAGVPASNFPPYLAKYAGDEYAKIGSLFEPDLEAVNAADADLIIVGGRSSAKFAELSKIAPTIDLTVDNTNLVDSVKSNVSLLGELFGREREAADKIAALDASIAAAREAASGAGKGLLILTTGGKMSAYGPGSRFGMLHSVFGVEPAREDLQAGNHGQAISFEFILEANPDWMFVIDRDAAIGREGSAAQQMLDNDLVGQTNAWKNGHVVYLDPVNWYLVGGGITALNASADQIAKALRKE